MTSKLLTPVRVGDLALKNRIIMSSLTRSRAGKQHIPNELLAEYYMQRASAGLVMTEATMIAADGCAFTAEAGIWDAERVAGWKQVTDAVHRDRFFHSVDEAIRVLAKKTNEFPEDKE